MPFNVKQQYSVADLIEHDEFINLRSIDAMYSVLLDFKDILQTEASTKSDVVKTTKLNTEYRVRAFAVSRDRARESMPSDVQSLFLEDPGTYFIISNNLVCSSVCLRYPLYNYFICFSYT